jgi:hypothetical protein
LVPATGQPPVGLGDGVGLGLGVVGVGDGVVGVGLGVVGVGDGVSVGLGLGDGEGLGEGLGVPLGDGLGDGAVSIAMMAFSSLTQFTARLCCAVPVLVLATSAWQLASMS